ncbi:MAG TPA: hypothetical protein VKD90_22745 [Gemmataceae bacterium]|nr:hypothetical protein [Gemmataceae bacterium]
MVRLSAILGVFLLIPVLGRPAPLPKDKPKTPPYFPSTVGTKWVFETSGGSEITEVIKAVEVKGTGTVVTVDREQSGQSLELIYLVSDDGISQLAVGTNILDPPHRLLKLPHVAGTTWEDRHRSTAVYGPERVEVPVGKFEAIRVEWEYPFLGGKMRHSEWYAPGVGPVRRSYRNPQGTEMVVVLKEFKPGRK